MSLFERLLKALERAVDVLAVTLFLAMFALVLVSVLLRTLGDPLVWSDELTRYLFVWVALLSWSIAARRGSHIAIGVVVDALPRRLRLLLQLIAHVAVLGFAVFLVVHGVRITLRNIDIDTITLFFTFAVVYAAAPLAATLVAIEALRRALLTLRAFRAPEPVS